MESTFNDNGPDTSAQFKAGEAGGHEVHDLIADVQDLLSQLAHVADPEISRLRSKVNRGLTAAKNALSEGTDQIQRQTRRAMSAGDGYVRDQPWQAVGIAAVAGLLAGYLVARRSRE